MQPDTTTPTHSIEAAKSVLGAVLVDGAAMETITGIMALEDLYLPAHRHLYAAMQALAAAGTPIDFTTLGDALKTAGKLEEAGGLPYLLELVDYVPTAANAAYYARIIRTHAVQRSLAGAGQLIIGKVRQGADVATVIDDARRTLDLLSGELDGAHGVNAADLCDFGQRAAAYQQFVARVNKYRFKTGFRELDKELRGVAPGEVIIIIAYSGTFKSALLQHLLLRSARDTGLFSLFFSLEMPAAKLFEREIAMTTGINGYTCEYRWRNEPAEANALQLAARDGGGKNLLICDRPALTVEQIGRYIDATRRNHGEIGVAGIDYLGLMSAPGKTLFERMAFLAPELKNLAKAKNIPLLVLAQVNRESVKTHAEIEAHSAKGGGDIEASADFLIGLQQTKQQQLILKVLKNRNGAAGQVWEMQLDRPSLQFTGLMDYEPHRQATNQTIDF